MERWERAAALGLNPPVEESPAVPPNYPTTFDLHLTLHHQVRDILTTKEGTEDTRLIQNVLYDEV